MVWVSHGLAEHGRHARKGGNLFISESWLYKAFTGLVLISVVAPGHLRAAADDGDKDATGAAASREASQKADESAEAPVEDSEAAADGSPEDDGDNADEGGADAASGQKGYEPGSGDLFEYVADQARARAEADYVEPEGGLPEALAGMDYSQYRGIRFREDAALWADHSPFRIDFFHPGFLYTEPVTIHAVSEQRNRELTFDSDDFEYGENIAGLDKVREAAESADSATGYAGFRVHYPLNDSDIADEVLVFLGASYFRMVGPDQDYGLSARGLAIDTAEPQGEEFPAFREFWLVRPDSDATSLRLYALLDSPSLTGAYRFELRPGAETRVDVKSRLFARTEVGKLGVAPLTSMFLFGENTARHYDDFRPEVHDSDGLLIHRAAGRWLWRPLTNPESLRVTSHPGKTPKGFGLAQRDREFEHYLDQQARYDRRPSLWVTPEGGDWGKGRVELVEIPSDSETNDNIGAYWVPESPLEAGDSRRYDYRVATFGAHRPAHELGRVARTRIGWGAVPGMSDPPPRRKRQFIVDFEGSSLARLGEGLPVEPVLETSSGEVEDLSASRLPGDGQWRVSFKLSPGEDEPTDMRLHLELRGKRLTETWNYVWSDDDRE